MKVVAGYGRITIDPFCPCNKHIVTEDDVRRSPAATVVVCFVHVTPSGEVRMVPRRRISHCNKGVVAIGDAIETIDDNGSDLSTGATCPSAVRRCEMLPGVLL
jgi:hypothetical protein